MLKEKLEKLALEVNTPCVSFSMNSHRTHPDNVQDGVRLKNLVKEAQERVLAEYDKKEVGPLLEKLERLEQEMDVNYLLDSLHVFVSNSTKEIIKSPWPTENNYVHISDRFAIKPLVKDLNRTQEYLIMLLSQSGVKLFLALNDAIVEEIESHGFPFGQSPYYLTDKDRISDAKQVDHGVREFFNEVDKSLNKIYHEMGLQTVVICTEDNYSRLQQVADNLSVYLGYVNINYNDTANHKIAKDAWKLVSENVREGRTEAINEMKEAVGSGKVITDLGDIYRAAKEGRGDLLIVHEEFEQPVKLTGEFEFEYREDSNEPGIVDDITSNIAWEVISKKGRAYFTKQDEIKSLGKIALKVRY